MLISTYVRTCVTLLPVTRMHASPRGGCVISACWKKLWKKWTKVRADAHDKHVHEVERTILRVRDLLQFGLGEAGAQIIRYCN
jgi:hypothetical protein